MMYFPGLGSYSDTEPGGKGFIIDGNLFHDVLSIIHFNIVGMFRPDHLNAQWMIPM